MSRAHGSRRRWWQRVSLERAILASSITAVVGLLVLMGVTGSDYYQLAKVDQIYSEERELFGTTGTFGMLAGAVAAGLFLSNFGYLLRRHLRFLEPLGTLRLWLDWHVLSALLGGGFVALHANFAMRNWIAQTCVYSVIVMIVTGLMGRYLLRFVPRSISGQHLDIASFEDEVLQLIDDVRADVVHEPAAVVAMQALVDELEADEKRASFGELRRRLRESRGYILTIEGALTASQGTRRRAEVRTLHGHLSRLGRQAALIHWAGRFMDTWRVLHRTFALLLLVGMVVHIFISLYYGYGAVWR
jgi:hypothetical protein